MKNLLEELKAVLGRQKEESRNLIIGQLKLLSLSNTEKMDKRELSLRDLWNINKQINIHFETSRRK